MKIFGAMIPIFFMLLAGCNGPDGGAPGKPTPPSVTVASVTKVEVAQTVQRVGQTQATEEVELMARVEGFLSEREFLEGSDVEKGKLLFVIEQAPYQLEVQRVSAELAKAKAEQTRARLDLRRIQTLRKRDTASQSELDNAIATEQIANAEVMAMEAELNRAKLNLGYTEIRAPFDGRIGKSKFSLGDLVNPQSGALATLVALDPIYVEWGVSEQVILAYRRRFAELMRDGKPTIKVIPRLKFADGSFYVHEGGVNFLDNRVDPATGTQAVRAVFPNPDKMLLPGQYVSVVIQIGEAEEQLQIPQSAVQQDQRGYYVLVIDVNNQAATRRVKLGDRRVLHWMVKEGLKEGEEVIYQGLQKVRPGMVVNPVHKEPELPALG